MILVTVCLIFALVVVLSLLRFRNEHNTSESVQQEVDANESEPEEEVVNVPESAGVRRRALLVGINKYARPGNDLRGCVNDVENLWELLTTKYDFDPDDVRVLTDERATKANILTRLCWLLSDVSPGDELLFTISGHGSQIRDRNGDELQDGLDEILCPHDLDWDDPLTDDDLAELFKTLPKGVFLTMICDTCHSGTMTRSYNQTSTHDGPVEQPRFLAPPVDVACRARGRELDVRRAGEKPKKRGNAQRHVLLSGCQDNQTSADAFIDGQYQGALTANLITVLEKSRGKDWRFVHEQVTKRLVNGRFTQRPRLSGDDELLTRPVLGSV